ncbi:MAG: Ig-like domain-containing protein [Ruminococcus sp.]|nr:Ig-like domain-containing protein [Ruminococcus sp.]
MRKEIDRIAIGSVDIYMQEFTGTKVSDIPADNAIETEANHIGRTKDGGEITYTTTYYNVKSDDGKAARNELTDDGATVSFGLITWNGDTITKLVPTASTTLSDGKRRTLIGGVANKNDKVYLIRAVHKDGVKGDVRYTFIGKNVNGFAAAYKPGQETTITPNITAEPFDDGRLIVLDEENAVGISLSAHSITVAAGSTASLSAVTAPTGQTVTWASADTSNATVSSGTVTGVAAGTATITASITVSGTTYTDSCTVTVTGAGA